MRWVCRNVGIKFIREENGRNTMNLFYWRSVNETENAWRNITGWMKWNETKRNYWDECGKWNEFIRGENERNAMNPCYWRSVNSKDAGRPWLTHHHRGGRKNWTKWMRWVWRNDEMNFMAEENGRNSVKNLPRLRFVHHETHMEWQKCELPTNLLRHGAALPKYHGL